MVQNFHAFFASDHIFFIKEHSLCVDSSQIGDDISILVSVPKKAAEIILYFCCYKAFPLYMCLYVMCAYAGFSFNKVVEFGFLGTGLLLSISAIFPEVTGVTTVSETTF